MRILSMLKYASLVAVISAFSGCACTTSCSGGPMARQSGVALRDVNFAFDSAELTATAKRTLQEDFISLDLAESSSRSTIHLEGRADERGPSQYNDQLAKRRIAAVRRYLIELGASQGQFEASELGERSPLASGSTPEAWAKNRSVRVLAM